MRTYYVVLGVPRDESDAGIRAAYRDRAKEAHPDHRETGSDERFRELQQAYEVLSDPDLRQRYDAELERAEGTVPVGRRRPVPPRSAPEPLIPEDRRDVEPLAPEPMSMFRDFQTVRPGREELRDRVVRSTTGLGARKADHLEALTVEIRLTPDQARRGTVVPLGVPVFLTCPRCGGTGADWLYPCVSCSQRGVVEEERTLEVRVPPGVRSGTVFELPLESLGHRDLYLRLLVRIGG